jgi:NADH-quinone oxidoreductase subunit L
MHVTLFSDLVQKVLPATLMKENIPPEIVLQGIAVVVTLGGIYTGYYLYYRNTAIIEEWKKSELKIWLRNFLFKGWLFDDLYNAVFVKPFVYLTQINKSDVFDQINKGIASASQQLNRWLSVSQNGSLRWYIAGVLIGIIFILTLQLVL